MSEALETLVPILLGMLVLGFLLDGWIQGRANFGSRGYWAFGWVSLLLAALTHEFVDETGLARGSALALATLFPALVLAGTYRFVERREPGWLIPCACGLGVARAGAHLAGFESFPDWVALLAEPPLVLTAAVLIWRSRSSSITRRLLPGPFLVLAAMEAFDALAGMRGVQVPWVPWLLVGLPVALLQVVSIMVRTEEDRRQAESRYDALAAHSNDLIAEIGPDGTLTYVSPNTERLLGAPASEMLGKRLTEVASRFGVTTDHLADEDTLEQILQREPFGTVRRVRDPSGRVRFLEVDGVEYRTPSGELRAVTISRDITERVTMEQQIRDTQKLESLGLLAGGIAHDFNNLLAVIQGNASLARDELADGSMGRSYLEEIELASERAANLTRNLLAYAGRGRLESEPLDLSVLVAETAHLLETNVAPDVRIDYDLAGGLPAVEGDAGELRQVVMNLIANAAEAISAPGRITVTTRVLDADASTLARYRMGTEREPGRYVMLRVEDTGTGMDDETQAQIFDPFYSTKGAGRGLGLAAMIGIVRSHGGALLLDSEPGGGTTFEILLAAGEGIPAPVQRAIARAPRRGSGTVLVVDDEGAVRRMASNVLEARGFEVLVAGDGQEGVEVFRKHAARVGAVVLDLTMPAMGGAAALDEIRRVRGDVPVLLTSGFSEQDARQIVREAGRASFLAKPYRSEDLADAVFALLDDPPILDGGKVQ